MVDTWEISIREINKRSIFIVLPWIVRLFARSEQYQKAGKGRDVAMNDGDMWVSASHPLTAELWRRFQMFADFAAHRPAPLTPDRPRSCGA